MGNFVQWDMRMGAMILEGDEEGCGWRGWSFWGVDDFQ